MTVRVGMLKSGMTAEDHRHALGVLALGTGQALQTRSGLVPGSAPTYTKVAGMTARVSPFQAWIDGTSQSLQGGYPFTSDADENVTFADGDATRARIDLVVARVYDQLYDASGQQLGRVMVVQGDYPVSGPAVAPAAPPSSIVLWEQPIPAGTTAGSGGINVGQAVRRWEYTAAAGGVVPVRNQAERDALAAYDGLVVARLDTGNLERRHQGVWGPSSDVTALLGAWSDFTPSISGVSYGTNPARSGRRKLLGKSVIAEARIVPGATATAPTSGFVEIAVSPDVAFGANTIIGQFSALKVGAPRDSVSGVLIATTTGLARVLPGSGGDYLTWAALTAKVPWNVDARIGMQFTYETP